MIKKYSHEAFPDPLQPARVAIRVLPDPNDRTPPQLLGSSPMNGATIAVTSQVRGQDDAGPLYAPTLRASFNEVIGPASLTAAAVTLIGPGGQNLPISVVSHPAARAVWAMPRQQLQSGAAYTLKLGPPLADEMGNIVIQTYSITFNPLLVGGGGALYLPLISR